MTVYLGFCPQYLSVLRNGYFNRLQNLLSELKTSTRLWVEQGEAYLLQLLDQLVAILMGIYPLGRSGSYNEIEKGKKSILLYVISCHTCLYQCISTGGPPVFKNSCFDCFFNKNVCKDQKDLHYTESANVMNIFVNIV